ncbi:MAG TPA: glycosyltransferase [Capillimicrobium sp.]|nr:glycosyltransferase [Capillimicrobium sp.]
MRLAIVTELRGSPDEGMRIFVRQVREALGSHHDVVQITPRGDERVAALNPKLAWRLSRLGPDAILYVPYSGLTAKSLLRLRVLSALTPRAATAICVLQADDRPLGPPGPLRPDIALYASDRLRRAVGGLAEREAVVLPAIDHTRFRPLSGDRDELRRELGLPTDKPIALHVGHLKASRNLELLGDVASDGNCHVVLVASTSTEPDAALRRRLETAGVTVVRRFLPNVEATYQAADLYVFPVEHARGSIEVPLSVLEARACGLPVIATRFGALPDLFADDDGVAWSEPERMRREIARHLHRPPVSPPDAIRSLTLERIRRDVELALTPPIRRGRALTVAITGVDGAGKSTQIERLRSQLDRRGIDAEVLWCRWDPFLAKPAIKLLDALSSRRSSNPNRSAASAAEDRAVTRRGLRRRLLANPLINTGWRWTMVVDYALRIAPRVRRARARRQVLLLDRYWHDVLVDLSFGQELGKMPAIVNRVLPDVDALVVLDVDEAVAHARKPESFDPLYLTDRRRLYREVEARHGAVTIDAGREVDEVANDLTAVLERLMGLDEGALSAS